MRRSTAWAVSFFALCFALLAQTLFAQTPASQVFGYGDFSQQAKWDKAFIAIPNAKLAGEDRKSTL